VFEMSLVINKAPRLAQLSRQLSELSEEEAAFLTLRRLNDNLKPKTNWMSELRIKTHKEILE
jgi:hypothetical protein